jgi:hypothetical protein
MRTFLIFLAVASPALAQDYIDQWTDEVGRDTQAPRAPLPRGNTNKPIYAIGVQAAYDTNLHLDGPDEEESETIISTFLRARTEYSDPKVDAVFDILASWNQYLPDKEYSDDEERVYLRTRYLGGSAFGEIAEIFRHESDPIDVVYADFVERYVSTTVGRIGMDLAGSFGVELAAQFNYVKFLESEFEQQDNWNLRADATVFARLTQTLDLVAQFGWTLIKYKHDDYGAPDVDGWYARAGLRGEWWTGFQLTLLGGVVKAETDTFIDGTTKEVSTGDIAVNLRWELSQRLTLWADYTRQVGFRGLQGDPFEVLNRATATLEAPLDQKFSLKIRGQYDLADTSLGLHRTYTQIGGILGYKSGEKWDAELGAYWRDYQEDWDGGDFKADGWVYLFSLIATN